MAAKTPQLEPLRRTRRSEPNGGEAMAGGRREGAVAWRQVTIDDVRFDVYRCWGAGVAVISIGWLEHRLWPPTKNRSPQSAVSRRPTSINREPPHSWHARRTNAREHVVVTSADARSCSRRCQSLGRSRDVVAGNPASAARIAQSRLLLVASILEAGRGGDAGQPQRPAAFDARDARPPPL